ncbi:hypothetical protein [Stygiolobus caldivivus]|uniref:Uncharacterized protein n=1 Tax=Stygiolobus caldivivus TaxID=2824673 RepID=A0A8D5U5H6_9CREN|nr:hypothetical protein [Stygiolobus caldivivus]BCU69910.1 hypothetical protein KN1_12070 [Stygiolobus caldivivus]
MSVIGQVVSLASGLSSLVSTVALVWTIYYYRKQTELLKTQIDEMKRQSSVQECLQLRDSTIRLHEVLTPLMVDEVNEIDNFREEINKLCSSPISCMTYVHNLFSKPEEFSDFREKVQRLLRDLKSLRVNEERFRNYEAFLEDIIKALCDLPYSPNTGSDCEVLEETDKIRKEYTEIIKLVDVLLAEDVKGNLMMEDGLVKEVESLGVEGLIDVMDKVSFIIDGDCGGRSCKDVFPFKALIGGEVNPLREMVEDPKGFCSKYGLKLVCEEYGDILDKVKGIVAEEDKSKVFYSLLYLNWITSRFKTLINTLQLPSEIDIRVRMKAELERITCITGKA